MPNDNNLNGNSRGMINWKVRMKNKTFLLMFAPFLISTLYQALAVAGVVPRVSQNQTMDIVIQFVNILGLLGIVVDGTTKGVTDSTGTIDWYKRFHNKTFLVAFFPALISFVYQIMSITGIAPRIDENSVLDIMNQLINILVLVGIVSDGTTDGFADSDKAMGYEEPQ